MSYSMFIFHPSLPSRIVVCVIMAAFFPVISLQLFCVILRRSQAKKKKKRICIPVCMFCFWPQDILPVWRIQEASWSDAQTTSAGSVAVMCHQTGLPSLSSNKSGQKPCFPWRLTSWINQNWFSVDSPHSSDTCVFCFHVHRDRSFGPPILVSTCKSLLG